MAASAATIWTSWCSPISSCRRSRGLPDGDHHHCQRSLRPGAAAALVQYRPDLIFHLAAIVSGEAEADFDKGYRINLDGTRLLFEAIRKAGAGQKPRLVFTSSIAVFGAPSRSDRR